MHTFKYQKLLLGFKIVESLQCILKEVYRDYRSSFTKLFETYKFVTMNQRKSLLIELRKVKNNSSTHIVTNIFQIRD